MSRLRYFVAAALSAILLAACVLPVSAFGETAKEEIVYSTAVYQSANTGSRIIGWLEQDRGLSVLEETDDFYRIDCFEMTGYVSRSQVAAREIYPGIVEYYVNCQMDSPETRSTQCLSLANVRRLQDGILEAGAQYLGVPYVHGGQSPSGFDCSGFTSYLYGRLGFQLHRVDNDQLQDGFIISKGEIQPGDLLFFNDGSGVVTSHVGIYAGNNQILHAGGRGITLASLDLAYFANNFVCARRVLCVARDEVKEETQRAFENRKHRARDLLEEEMKIIR